MAAKRKDAVSRGGLSEQDRQSTSRRRSVVQSGIPPDRARIWPRACEILADQGFGGLLRAAKSKCLQSITRLVRSRRQFSFEGRRYHYFCHPYNRTWINERSVEVAICWPIVLEHGRRRVMEVGNVLAHYFPVSHEVIDKYERGVGVLNVDVLEFRSSARFDLIISISTLEHVGWDETPRQPGNVVRAVSNLVDHLAIGGKLVATIPLGANPELDRMIDEGAVTFDERRYLRRVSVDNRWVQAEYEEVRGAAYGSPFPFANALLVGTVHR